MPRTAKFPGSSNIKAATVGDDGVLEVTFQNGQKARYANFKPEMMDEWEKDKSPGGWFHRNVRSKPSDFPHLKGGPGEPTATDAELDKLDAAPEKTDAVAKVIADAKSSMGDQPLEQATPSEVANAMTLAADIVVEEDKCTESVRVAARAMYESYVTNARGKNYEGKPCPKWEDLTAAIRGHWCAAAITASCEFQHDLLQKIDALEAEAKKLKMMLPWRNRGGARS